MWVGMCTCMHACVRAEWLAPLAWCSRRTNLISPATQETTEATCLDFLPHHFLLTSVGESGVLRYQDTTTGQMVATHRTKLGPCDVMRQNPWNAAMCLGHGNGTGALLRPLLLLLSLLLLLRSQPMLLQLYPLLLLPRLHSRATAAAALTPPALPPPPALRTQSPCGRPTSPRPW